jgi:hypothetical protein
MDRETVEKALEESLTHEMRDLMRKITLLRLCELQGWDKSKTLARYEAGEFDV